MNIVTLREKLHEYIDNSDEQQLSVMYLLVKEDISLAGNIYDEATMTMFYQRREDHRNGLSKSYTMEETFELARKSKF
jgi:hypothetical protein